MEVFFIINSVILIALFTFAIVIFCKWLKMVKDINEIKEHFINNRNEIIYQIAIGNKDKATKNALLYIMDQLYAIYFNPNCIDKASRMNKVISEFNDFTKNLDLHFPYYINSGKTFIDYMNKITGNKVEYSATIINDQYVIKKYSHF